MQTERTAAKEVDWTQGNNSLSFLSSCIWCVRAHCEWIHFLMVFRCSFGVRIIVTWYVWVSECVLFCESVHAYLLWHMFHQKCVSSAVAEVLSVRFYYLAPISMFYVQPIPTPPSLPFSILKAKNKSKASILYL